MRVALASWCVACLIGMPAIDRAIAAEVVISVNKATQTMSVLVDGAEAYHWKVSTGLGGGPYNGTYRPGRMERKWFSRKYNMAPMPYSIFFDGNYAIHGTVKTSLLGRRASKGCVRLHPNDAATLFALVQKEKATTSIVVSGDTHVAARPAPAVAVAPDPLRPSLPADALAAVAMAEPAAMPVPTDSAPAVNATPTGQTPPTAALSAGLPPAPSVAEEAPAPRRPARISTRTNTRIASKPSRTDPAPKRRGRIAGMRTSPDYISAQ